MKLDSYINQYLNKFVEDNLDECLKFAKLYFEDIKKEVEQELGEVIDDNFSLIFDKVEYVSSVDLEYDYINIILKVEVNKNLLYYYRGVFSLDGKFIDEYVVNL